MLEMHVYNFVLVISDLSMVVLCLFTISVRYFLHLLCRVVSSCS